MPLPISKSQVRKLGSRLRAPGSPSDNDVLLLNTVLASYDETLQVALELMQDLGLRPVDRVKNSGTIVEKLRRGEGTDLARIQDIAGARIILDPEHGRAEQDRVRDLVVGRFSGEAPPRVHDRRAEPSFGYRAVHVVVRVLDLPVEIQIRTAAQHRWAEFFEKLADELGRGIRYGGAPETLDVLLTDHRFDGARTRLRASFDSLVETSQRVADIIARLEVLNAEPESVEELWTDVNDLMDDMRADTRELMDGIRSVLAS